MSAFEKEDDLAKAAEALRASAARLTPWPNAIRSNDLDDAVALTVEIRIGDTRIGHFYVEGWSDEHVRIDMIAIDRHHRRHRYGMEAMALLRRSRAARVRVFHPSPFRGAESAWSPWAG